MAAFGYPISLEVTGRTAVVIGEEAVDPPPDLVAGHAPLRRVGALRPGGRRTDGDVAVRREGAEERRRHGGWHGGVPPPSQ